MKIEKKPFAPKILLITLFILGGMLTSNAQFFNIGLKGGFGSNENGDLIVDLDELGEMEFDSERGLGYHFGVIMEFKLPLWLLIRPEIVYTHTETGYILMDQSIQYEKDRIDVPILLGFRILKIARIYLGPSFEYTLESKLVDENNERSFDRLTDDDFSVSGQFGIGLDFGRFGFDLRYELGLTSNDQLFVNDMIDSEAVFLVDDSHQQFILSAFFKFRKNPNK